MTLDSNIVIAYLAGEKVVVEQLNEWRREGKPLFLSMVVEAEVLSFGHWTPRELAETERFLEENFTPIVFDRIVARLTANIRRQVKLKFPDAAIAATAFFTGTALVTRDQRDFSKISKLQVITV